jgi:hypothetical protein
VDGTPFFEDERTLSLKSPPDRLDSLACKCRMERTAELGRLLAQQADELVSLATFPKLAAPLSRLKVRLSAASLLRKVK